MSAYYNEVEKRRRMTVRWVRYVRHERVDAFLRCGWMLAFDIGGAHREWSVGMVWLCECPLREPPQ
jgi:hypothetical protein